MLKFSFWAKPELNQAVKQTKGEQSALTFRTYLSSTALPSFFKCITDNPYNEEWCKNTTERVFYQ